VHLQLATVVLTILNCMLVLMEVEVAEQEEEEAVKVVLLHLK
jgi:hypothetical protein